jgi:non-heme chloroperoxidase
MIPESITCLNLTKQARGLGELELAVMVVAEQSVELHTGLTLRYAEHGEATGVALLLLPGLGDSWRSFEPVLEHLPNSIRALALTLRGHGDSSHPEAGYEFDDFASDVEAFMNTLKIQSAVLVAHSASGFFAQRFAIDHPERALGLVFIGSPLTLRNHQGLNQAWEGTFSTLADPIDPQLVRDMQSGTLAKRVPDDFFEVLVAEGLKVPARVWREVFQHLLEQDLSEQVGNIRAPTLVVWGDQDATLSRADQEALVNAIRGSQLVVYEGGGHSPHWEEPRRFASDLATFVVTLDGKNSALRQS